jgi:lipopolysaccharide export system protein LptA
MLFAGLAGGAQAERADRDKPVHLEANQVLIDEARQFSRFEGRVQLIQGTLLIQADSVEVREDGEGYQHLTAIGRPARFRQRYEGTNEYAEGYGNRIEYDTRTETVDFHDQARVKRGADEVQGAHITYSTRTEVFQARGGAPAVDGSGGRVRAVLQPKRNPGTDTQPASIPLPIQPSDTLLNIPRP